MVVESLTTSIPTPIFSFGGGALLGAISGYAIKRVVKFAAIIVGLFVLGLAFLSYKGLLTANWDKIEQQTQSFTYNATQQMIDVVNNTASKFSHSSVTGTEITPIAGVVGFASGFLIGVKK